VRKKERKKGGNPKKAPELGLSLLFGAALLPELIWGTE
jgi:hypothetical protein